MHMAISTDTDRAHLARAIELAAQRSRRGQAEPARRRGGGARRRDPGGGLASRRYGAAHAEVNAIEACGLADLSGATLYVSLEPCCHEGRTPPCTDAILQAGIRRVVVASDDPDREGVRARALGSCATRASRWSSPTASSRARARLLNQPFRKHARVGRPWVLFKSAMTLDGKVATRSGDSKWISGEESRELAHRWRASVDAVVVGIGTALADDPQLTARPDGLPAELARQPRRVVFDSLARLPLGSQLVRRRREIPLTVVVSRAAARADTDALEAAGVAGARRHRRERARARALRARPARRAWASPRCCSRAVRTSRAPSSTPARSTRLRLFLAPLLLGGSAARDPLEGEGSSASPRRCAR